MTRMTIVALGLLLAGCTATPAPAPTPAPSGAPSPTLGTPTSTPTSSPAQQPPTSAASVVTSVTVHKTGGFAGVDETITVDPQGAWRRAGHNVTKPSGKLTADQLSRLRALAADPRIDREASVARGPSKCMDTFNYRVTVRNLEVRYTDCPSDANPPQATMALVEHVVQATH